MTHHLTRDELIDSLDGRLPSTRQAHAETCAACRAEAASLREVLRDVAAVALPEPSPLFWDHLSARIRERVAEAPLPDRAATGTGLVDGWLPGWWPRRVFAVVVLALCAGLGWTGWHELRQGRSTIGTVDAGTGRQQDAGRAGDRTDASRVAARDGTARAEASADASTPGRVPAVSVGDHGDREWTLMMRVAEDVAWEDAEVSSMEVRPATVEGALGELTSDERRSLAQLVQAELARPPL